MTRFIADDKVVYQWMRREIRLASDNSWARRSFEARELKITVNYFPVYTWIENGCYMRNLTSSPVPFRLVLLTEHKVLHCYATNAVYRCLVAGHCTRLAASLQQTVDASKFPALVGQFTQHSPCTILLWQIEIFNQNHIFLWNFHDFV